MNIDPRPSTSQSPERLFPLADPETFLAASLRFLLPKGAILASPTVPNERLIRDLIGEAQKILEAQESARSDYILRHCDPRLSKGCSDDQKEVFALLSFRHEDSFRCDRYEETVTEAAQKNDYQFFIALGKVLQKPPLVGHHLDKVMHTLLALWTYCGGSHPPLCYFTDQSIIDVYAPTTTLSALRKQRERAGLIQSSLYKVKAVPKGNRTLDWQVISRDPRLSQQSQQPPSHK